jgi:homoserine kinase
MEGHPDNVAPALYGGAVLTVLEEGRVDGPLTVVPFAVPADWRAVLYVPDLIIPTKQARAILPKEVPRADSVFNHSRVGLLVAALTQHRSDFLRVAMQDRLHQPYRAKLFPEMEELIRAGIEGGAWGAALSGAGSAILTIASRAKADGVAAALSRKAEALTCPARAPVPSRSPRGARVLPAELK